MILVDTWDTSRYFKILQDTSRYFKYSCDCCHISGVPFVPRQLGSLPGQMVCAGRGSPSRFHGLRAPGRPHCPTGGPLNVRPGRGSSIWVHWIRFSYVFFQIFSLNLCFFLFFSDGSAKGWCDIKWCFKRFWVTIAAQVEMFPRITWHLLTCCACLSSQARESFVITTGSAGTSKLGSSPTKSKVRVTRDSWLVTCDDHPADSFAIHCYYQSIFNLLHLLPIYCYSLWLRTCMNWFWWLEVVGVISRVNPSRILSTSEQRGLSNGVFATQAKKSKKKKSTCCWDLHFRSVETTRVSWPDLPFPIWPREQDDTRADMRCGLLWLAISAGFQPIHNLMSGICIFTCSKRLKMLLQCALWSGLCRFLDPEGLSIPYGGDAVEGTIGVFQSLWLHRGLYWSPLGAEYFDATPFANRNGPGSKHYMDLVSAHT